MSRYQNLKIITAGNNTETKNLVSYFDKSSVSRSIVFWAFHTGTGNSFTRRTTMDNDGGTWYSDVEKVTNGTTGSDYSATTNNQVGLRTPSNGVSRVNVTAGAADSLHFDLKYDKSRDNAYLVYYDETNSELLIRWNNSPFSTPAGWSSPFKIDEAAGQYVKMVLDDNGCAHLAYYDGTGSYLKYALLTPTLDGLNNISGMTTTKCVVVDALFTNGMYNGITLREFSTDDIRPVIVSYSITYGGTRNALKVSWSLTTVDEISAGADTTNSAYTGTWEVLAVAASTPPAQDYSFVETNGTSYTGDIVVGYNGAVIEQARLLPGLF